MDDLHIPYKSIELGKVDISATLSKEQYRALNTCLKHYELEIMDDRKVILVERIKALIVEMIGAQDGDPPVKFTVYLNRALGYDYTYLSNVFSEEEDSTIERFYITSRIDRVKQMMIEEELSLKEIAFRLNYSSVAYLSLQFKKVTGITITAFKNSFQPKNLVKKCE